VEATLARYLTPLFVAALLLLLNTAPALAHAEFVSGAPGPGDEVVASPVELVIEFSQDLDPSRTSLEVRDASGVTVARGGEVGDGPREFRLALPELAPGAYEVRWTSFSAEDGELARGSYDFTLVAAPSPSISATPSPTTVPDGASPRGADAVLIPIVVALLAVGAIGIWLVRRKSA
jgi:methionine-rich copper-binding protein CopC